VTSGKGGVGKTSLAINLAVATARLGHRVGLLDADFALGNVDVLLGLSPDHHLGAVLTGTKSLADVTLEGPSGVRVIPGGSGIRALTALDEPMWARLIQVVDDASRDLDFLFFDTATGISDNVLDVIGLADHVLVVTCLDPAAVVDAYAVIKLVTASQPDKSIGVVVNAAADADEGALVFRQISAAADRFLGRTLRYEGHVPDDRSVRESGLAQMPFIGGGSPGEADRCIRRMASRLVAGRPGSGPWPAPPAAFTTSSPATTESSWA
jgi:flagellar biosynthesis protein FlhG